LAVDKVIAIIKVGRFLDHSLWEMRNYWTSVLALNWQDKLYH